MTLFKVHCLEVQVSVLKGEAFSYCLKKDIEFTKRIITLDTYLFCLERKRECSIHMDNSVLKPRDSFHTSSQPC
jgi:hypothetical protein